MVVEALFATGTEKMEKAINQMKKEFGDVEDLEWIKKTNTQ